jgi:HEAT repeat protein
VRTAVGDNAPDTTHPGHLVPTSEMGVFTTDTTLTVRTWDAWLAQTTGIAPDAARGRTLLDLVPDLSERGLTAVFDQVLSRGVVEILAPAFHRYLVACPPALPSPIFDRMQQRVTIGPLREDGRIIGTIVAVEDVTARLEHERALAAQLASVDPDVRLRAAQELASNAAIGNDPLLNAIGDDDWRVRRAAVSALSRRSSSDVIAAVLEALRNDHHNFSVLSSAIELLASGETEVVEPLLELLRTGEPDLRLQAALVLGERGDARAAPALLETLSEPDDNLRFHAIEALGKLKASAAVDRLIGIAESGDFFLGFPALDALARIGDSTIAPRLVPLLTHELLRGPVANVLGSIGDDDVVEPLTALLNEATAPTEIVADALARVSNRFEERYHDAEHIADRVRGAISATGTQNLLDAVQHARAEDLPSIAKVLAWLEGPAVDRALTLLLALPSVRAKAVEYLVRQGPRVVDLLIEQLAAEDLDTRHAAIVGLGRIGDRRATPALLDVLAAEPSLVAAAAGALARIGDGRAFDALLGFVGHEDPAVRQAVIAALNSIGHPDMGSRTAPLLRDPSPRVRESAVRIAGYFGFRECADDLLLLCRDVDPAVRRAAIEHLAFLDDERVFGTLGPALHDSDPRIRAAAVQAIARVDDPAVAASLTAALRDPDAWVRYFATRALGEHRHAAAVDDVTRLALDDGAGQVRLAAVGALGRIGSPVAVPALAALSASDDSERAIAAIDALGSIPHEDAWPPLEAALRAAGEDRRTAAAAAVARLGGPRAIDLLEWTAAADTSGSVAAAAVQGLASIAAKEDGRPAVKALVDLAAEAARRDLVVPALAALPNDVIASIAEGLHDPRPQVRVAVVQSLGRMRRADASRWLQSALDDGADDVRTAALNELRHLGTRGVERRIVTLARTDPSPAVRRGALAVLKAASGGRESARFGAGNVES